MKLLSLYSLLPLAFVMRSVSAQDTPLPMYIGDNAVHTIYKQATEDCPIEDVEINLGLEHTFAGDIKAVIQHPDGTQVTLVEEGEGGGNAFDKDNLIFYRGSIGTDSLQSKDGVVSTQTKKVESLAAFDGKPSAGLWKLLVSDNTSGDTGTVDHFMMKFVCQGGDDSGEGLNDMLPPGGDDSLLSPLVDPLPSLDDSGLDLPPNDSSSDSTGDDYLPTLADLGSLGSLLPPGLDFDFSGADDATTGADDSVPSVDSSLPGADDPLPGTNDSTVDGDDPATSTNVSTSSGDDPASKGADDRIGGGGGDPHFKTWTGMKYDYHGECDLVLLNNPEFADGLGMRVHIRTVRDGYFSYIERTAIKIGDDVLEFASRKKWTLNGEEPKKGRQSIGGFEMYKFKKAISIRLDNSSKTKIDLFDRANGMPYIVIDGGSSPLFEGSLGMIGDWATGLMIGRDGETVIEDPDDFAREWQVRNTEPMLFSTIRAPQYPAVCIPPKKIMGNRLGSSNMMKMAEKACAAWGDDKDNCIFDVMATRDIRAAEGLAVNM